MLLVDTPIRHIVKLLALMLLLIPLIFATPVPLYRMFHLGIGDHFYVSSIIISTICGTNYLLLLD